jgi:putative addiction module component (TIGR02574 family)
MNAEHANLLNLSPAERLLLVEDLWDSLAATPEVVPLLDWHKQELDRRLDDLDNNPDNTFSWEEVVDFARNRRD